MEKFDAPNLNNLFNNKDVKERSNVIDWESRKKSIEETKDVEEINYENHCHCYIREFLESIGSSGITKIQKIVKEALADTPFDVLSGNYVYSDKIEGVTKEESDWINNRAKVKVFDRVKADIKKTSDQVDIEVLIKEKFYDLVETKNAVLENPVILGGLAESIDQKNSNVDKGIAGKAERYEKYKTNPR